MKKILALALALMMLLGIAAVVRRRRGNHLHGQPGLGPGRRNCTGRQVHRKTGITVDFQIIPADQYTTVLMTKLQTGEDLDLFGSQAGKSDIVTQ